MSLTGRIGKPMITLHGDLDALLPIRTDSDVYDAMIDGAGRGSLHRYYTIQGGNHVDDRADQYPDEIRPILPCYREAFLRLTAWVTRAPRRRPTRPSTRQPGADEANTCPQLAATSSGHGHGGGR